MLAKAALRAFHAGLRRGGRTETVSCGAAGGRPYLRCLLAAGLGGLSLLSSLAPLAAEAATLSSLRVVGDGAATGPAILAGFVGGVSGGGETQRLMACVAMAQGAKVEGSVRVKAAAIAGFSRGGAWDGTRLAARMSAAEFDAFALAHELGHCADPSLSLGADAAGPPGEHARHAWEVFADAYAVLATARDGRDVAVADEWADLRIIGLVTNGLRGQDGDAWARYYTTPAIEAAAAWARQVGEPVRLLTDAQLAEAARAIAAANTLTPAQHAALVAAVRAGRAEDGSVRFDTEPAPGFSERLEAALRRSGAEIRRADAVPAAR